MGNRTLRLLAILILSTWVAACSDDGGTPIDARVCTPVDDNNVCTDDVCENNQPVHNPVAAGTTCPTGTCNAAGMCVAPTCTDGSRNGTETDVDCGGSCAPASTCDTGEGCAVPADCASGVCNGTTCVAPACGDGVTQAGEMCDDGNHTNGDGCDDGTGGTCRPTGCGNGTVTGTEACDDGNATNGDGCDNNCTVTACGNGVTAGSETCDDGNTANADGCTSACATEAGFTCTTAVPSVCTTTCGDGIRAGAEGCDDAPPAENGDGCSATCTVETGYSCTGTMPSVCMLTQVCGNGILEGTETCDQGGGNTANGDGCSSACLVETGWSCTGTPSVCTPICGDSVVTPPETCDDGNTAPADGCSATCRTEPGEIEPNEDGTPSTGGSGIAGNDFDAAGGIAVMNANNNGAFNVNNGNLAVIAAISPAGDEDVFAVTNTSATAQSVRFDVWSRAAAHGFGVACVSTEGMDTGLNIRNAAGTVLTSNDDRNGAADRCSGLDFVMTPGQTVYAHVVDFGDTDLINTPGYALTMRPTPVACGNGTQTIGFEECDDGNTTAGDGCSATCTIEGTNEVEPNEDGTPATGGTGIVGNDFDVGGSLATTNATAQGVVNVGTTGRIWLAALTPAGDEDVFALTNSAATPVEVTVDTWDPVTGINRPCPAATVDTGINVRDAAGAVLTSNDSRAAGDGCSRVTFIMAPGSNRYVHVVEFGDNAVITRYVTQITRRAVVCGDSILVPAVEECDDGNTVDTDACTNACLLGGTVNEVEPNGTTAEADANAVITADTQIRGAIGSTTDVDFFKLTVSAFTVLRLETFVNLPGVCDTTTTTLRIMNSAGTEITNDNAGSTNASGIAACAALVFPAPPGTYYVKVEETGVNAAIAKYFLQVDFLTDAGAETEPNETSAAASNNVMAATNAWVTADHTLNTDSDFYMITIPPGQALRAEVVEGDRAIETCEGNNVDSRLTLFDTNGTTQLVDDDDDGRGFCSAIDGTGNTARDSGARNTGTTPKVVFLQVRQSSFATTGTDGQFIYKLAVTVR